MQVAIVVSIRGCGGNTQEFHLGIASPYSRRLGPKARGCTHGGQNKGVCRVLFCPLVMLVSFSYFFSFTTFPRNDGERDLGRDRGALAVAHGTAGGDPEHGRGHDDVGHAHELVAGDEAQDDRQDLQDGSDNVDFDFIRHDRVRGGVCWTY